VWNDTYNFTQGWQSSTSLQITNLTPGVYFWQAQASDDMGPSPWSPVWSFSINIAPGVSGGEVSIIAGDTVGLQVQTVDADNQSLTLAASDLPSFVTFTDNHNGIGTLAIAPQEANEGTYSITVSASDGTLTGSGTISLTVLPQLLTVHADASGCVATGVSFSLSQGSADSFVIKRNGTQVGTATGTATSYTDSISWWIGGTITYEVDAIQSGAQFAAGTVSFDYHSCGTAPFRSVSSQTNYSTQNSMPAGMAMDNQGCLWVANYYSSTGVVSALCSANSYNVTYQVATCSSPNGVAFDGTLIWVACYGASKLVAINPTTQSVVGNGIATPANPYSLSYANGKLFVNTWNSNVQAYDPTTGQLVCTVAAKTYYGQMAFSNGIGYVSDDATQTIVRFHTSDCSSTGSPISMGFAADRGITVCGGSVFAAYETGNQIGKYDLSTGTVSAFNLGNYPTGLTCDGASVWITNYSGNEVIRMAFDGTIYATYITPSGGNNAIFDGNSVWASDSEGSVTRFLESDGPPPLRSISSQTNYSTQNSMPAGMAMDNQGCLWVANYYSSTGVVSALCSTNSYNVTYQVATCSSPNGVAFDGTLIWVSCYGASKLVAINPTTQSVVGNGITTPANPYSLSYADGKLFVNTWNSNVQAYNPTTGQLACTVAAKTYYGQMAFSNGIGYVSDDATQTIVRFHTSDCSSAGSPISMGFAADRGITVCGGSVFAAYETGNQIGKYDLSTGAVSAFNLGNYPTGLTCDGASVWITNYSGNEVIRMAFDGTIYATYTTPSGGNNAIFDGNSVWVSDSGGSVTRFLES
jgi:hypothetical protein